MQFSEEKVVHISGVVFHNVFHNMKIFIQTKITQK